MLIENQIQVALHFLSLLADRVDRKCPNGSIMYIENKNEIHPPPAQAQPALHHQNDLLAMRTKGPLHQLLLELLSARQERFSWLRQGITPTTPLHGCLLCVPSACQQKLHSRPLPHVSE